MCVRSSFSKKKHILGRSQEGGPPATAPAGGAVRGAAGAGGARRRRREAPAYPLRWGTDPVSVSPGGRWLPSPRGLGGSLIFSSVKLRLMAKSVPGPGQAPAPLRAAGLYSELSTAQARVRAQGRLCRGVYKTSCEKAESGTLHQEAITRCWGHQRDPSSQCTSIQLPRWRA